MNAYYFYNQYARVEMMKWNIANQRAVQENVEIERRFLVDVESLPIIRASASGEVKIDQWYPPSGEIGLLPENRSSR